jgi:hypothetical protein
MDVLTLIVVGVIFCALIVSVFMVAYRYNTMSKEIRSVGNLVKKQLRAQSSLNAKVLETVDKQEEGGRPSEMAPPAIGTTAPAPSDRGVIVDMLKEIIERLDDIDVVLAEHLSSSADKTATIPPVKRSRPVPESPKAAPPPPEPVPEPEPEQEPEPEEEPPPFVPPGAVSEATESQTTENEADDNALPEPPPGLVQAIGEPSVPGDADRPSLPPFLRSDESGGEEKEEMSARERLLDKTVVRCPSCSRQLPYDALKIQDEQTCPYCNEVFRSNDYLLALINEGASARKPTTS